MTDEQFKVCDLCGNTAGPGRNIKHNVDCPNHPDALDALQLARDWAEREERTPTHVVVFMATAHEGGGDGIKFFQSGDYRAHAQVGMVIEGLDLLRGSGWTEYGK